MFDAKDRALLAFWLVRIAAVSVVVLWIALLAGLSVRVFLFGFGG